MIFLALLGLWHAVPTKSQEVGEVARVREALGRMPQQDPWKLAVTEPVQIGLTASLGTPRSFIVLKFDKRNISVASQGARFPTYGSFTAKGIAEFTIEEAQVEEGTEKLFLGLLVKRGELRMAFTRQVLHEVSIRTREIWASSNDTYYRMHVNRLIGTFLAVDEGTALVELLRQEDLSGAELSDREKAIVVTAGHWILVPPAGSIQRGKIDPARDPLDDPPLIDCCDFRTGPPEPPLP